MAENKEETLANFQTIAGIDDVGEALCHLEAVNWNLEDAVNRVMPHDDTPLVHPIHPPEPPAPDPVDHQSSNGFRFTSLDDMPGPSNARLSGHPHGLFVSEPLNSMYPTSQWLAQQTSNINLDPSRQNNDHNLITFNIHFNQQLYQICLPSMATVEQLKRKIFDVTNVPLCRQAIRGWPPSRASEALLPSTLLSNLDLSPKNELILIDLTNDGFMDTEHDESSQRLDKIFTIKIVEGSEGQPMILSLPGRTTIQELKQNVDDITNIPVRHQEWSGWPAGCDNETTLAHSGIELTHNFTIRNIAEPSHNNSNLLSSNEIVTVDSENSADEYEDASESDFVFTDPSPVQPLNRFLIPSNVDSEICGSTLFVENYKQRFGEPCPNFFVGSLQSAIREACHKPAKERKLLAIYLHHGESILTNVFCDHLMKHEHILPILEENFILYGWDLTCESNKDMFLSLLTACISSTASLTARNIKLDKLPAIMLVGRSRLLGRSSCEVLSVIHGNIGVDDLYTRLIDTYKMYEEQLQDEIREENERAARDQVKAEQDKAYAATLEADMAKEAAKRQKEAAQLAERKRIESERAEEDARRESIRLVAEHSLPPEPAAHEPNISKIRVRKPTGDYLERRFHTRDTLQDLLNFVAANGFLIDEFKLICSWPRRDLTAINANQTLEALKLFPQETVILEER